MSELNSKQTNYLVNSSYSIDFCKYSINHFEF